MPTPMPWSARCALVAAAGLVVGGAAYGTVEVVSALSPSEPVAPSDSAGPGTDEPTESERRTVSLLPDPAEEAEAPEEAEAVGDAGGSAVAVDPGTEGAGGAAGTSGGTSGGTAPGNGADPRGEILEELLNSPQPRPPMEPLVDQEDIDAERESAEAEVEPETVEFPP
ncbi:hypothetical protein HNR06_003219 [Nocardiopsis arvandica]|uniref:Uncharacterized protein n=1 Tax=Nocardiopsis sinuspersici TaxID=501010 RepID=A0A7Y9XFV1_9ACTN|nr:hypothetical protein [Nocardiopsis sinuspersici]NYH53630.1 hypothetical protein [Nocardiopsis sinuspersici]